MTPKRHLQNHVNVMLVTICRRNFLEHIGWIWAEVDGSHLAIELQVASSWIRTSDFTALKAVDHIQYSDPSAIDQWSPFKKLLQRQDRCRGLGFERNISKSRSWRPLLALNRNWHRRYSYELAMSPSFDTWSRKLSVCKKINDSDSFIGFRARLIMINGSQAVVMYTHCVCFSCQRTHCLSSTPQFDILNGTK